MWLRTGGRTLFLGRPTDCSVFILSCSRKERIAMMQALQVYVFLGRGEMGGEGEGVWMLVERQDLERVRCLYVCRLSVVVSLSICLRVFLLSSAFRFLDEILVCGRGRGAPRY